MSLANNPRPTELIGPTTDGTWWSETATGANIADTPTNGEKQSGVAALATYTSARKNWFNRLVDKWVRHIHEMIDVEHSNTTGGHKASTFTSASSGNVKVDITGHASDNVSTTNQVRLRDSALTTIWTVTLSKLSHLIGNFSTQVETPEVSLENVTGSPTTLVLNAYAPSGTGIVTVSNSGTGTVAQLNVTSNAQTSTLSGTVLTTETVRAGILSLQAVASTPTTMILDAYRGSALGTVSVTNSAGGGTAKLAVTGTAEVSGEATASRYKTTTTARTYSYPGQAFNGDSVSSSKWKKPGSSTTPDATAAYGYVDENSATSYFVDMSLHNLEVGDVITSIRLDADRTAGAAALYLASQAIGTRTYELTASILSGSGAVNGTAAGSITVASGTSYFLVLEVANGTTAADMKIRRAQVNLTREYLG